MLPRFAKVSEIADRFRVSVDAVYLWIRQGKIPSDCVIRIAGTVRVDEEQFEQRLRSGALCHPRGRRTSETGSVQPEHPFSTENDTLRGPNTEHWRRVTLL